MAAPDNVNDDQFEDHRQTLSDVEGEHGIELTPRGLKHGAGFAPAVNIESGTYNPSEYSKDKRPIIKYINLDVPSEDPQVLNSLSITTPRVNSLRPGSNGVQLTESHTYPGGDPDNPIHTFRWSEHEDVPTAMDHLKKASQERADHLGRGTAPEDEYMSRSGMERMGRWNREAYSHNPNQRMTPPDTLKYHPSNNYGERYTVDTGTRDVIPEEDQ